MGHQRDHEHDLLEDWNEVKRTAGIVLRYPRTILLVTSLVVGLVTLVTMSRGPTYRASLTLKLDDEQARNPILEDLSVPTGTVEADEAVATLRSSRLLRELVATPADGALAHPGHPEYARHMGLTTLVERDGLGTVRGYVEQLLGRGSPDFRVFAQLDLLESGAPDTLVARFTGDGQVELSVPPDMGSASWPPGFVTRVPFEPEQAIELRGVRLRLSTSGTPDARAFRIRTRTEEEAMAWVSDRLGVVEMPDEASTVLVSMEDVDAQRATEVANALSQIFLEFDAQRTGERAREIVDYIDSQLSQRSTELARLNTDISRILERYPDAIDFEKGFLQLNDRRGILEQELLAVAALRRSLEEMATQIASGNRAMASRLGQQLDDPMTRRYLDSIALLTDERLRVNRDETGSYQTALRAKQIDARQLLHEIQGRLNSIDLLIADLAEGDASALGRVGDAAAQGGMTAVDDLTLRYAQEYVKASEELALLELEFTPTYPAVATKRQQMQGLYQTVLAHLESRREAVALELSHTQGLHDRWSELLDARPQDEEAQIGLAVEALWTQVEDAVGARVAGLAQEQSTLVAELEDVELRIADLPEAQRLLKEPEVEQASLQKVVSTLIEKKEMAAVAAAGAMPTVELLRRARVPRSPISPSIHLGLAVGLLLGTFLSVGSCLLHENFRGRLRSETDYAELADVPLFATLRGSRGAGSFEGSDEKSADAFRALRARLRQVERERGGLRSIAVTSSVRAEGKTSASAGLAAAYALEGRRVLLIDANLRHPQLHEHLGLDPAPGLAEALDGRKHWMQCVAPVGLPGLDTLVAGKPYYAPADLLSGLPMERLLAEVADSYDMVILDLPCVEGLPDVACVAPLLDGLLLLCSDRRGPTRRGLQQTVRQLAACGAPLLGVVRQLRSGPLETISAAARSRAAA